MATESHTSKASLTGTPKRNGGVDTIPTCTSTDKVARWRLEAAQENLSDPEGNRAKPDAANAGATETGLVAATAPRKLLTVHRRLMLDTKRLIKSLESCETKREFDFESRKFNLLKSEYENFRYSASELKDVELNQLSSEIADKFKKCVNMFETVKDKICDKTNPLNEGENDCDNDDMGPADSVLIAASSTSVTSSKSSIVKQIELERRRSELQVLEELARSRKVRVEAEAKAKAEAVAAAAAAEEEETLAKLRLEAIELEAEEKRIACGSEAGSVVSGRSRRSVRSTSSAVSFKSSLIKNAEFKRSAEPTHGTEAGSKPEVGAMLFEHKASELRLRPLVTEPRPRSNEPQPMQLEQKRNSFTNVTNSINEKFNAMFTNDKSTVLNPQARGFIPQHVSGSRNHNSAAYHNDYAENSENVQRCVSRRVLDAENQHTVLRTAEYRNSGNSNAGPDPCPQFRVNAARGGVLEDVLGLEDVLEDTF